jgi:hypothetical protein
MACVPVPVYQQFWADKRSSLQKENKDILRQYPDAASSVKQLFKVLCELEDLSSFTPLSVGQSEEWAAITSSAEENRENFCKVLRGKTLFSALYGIYTVTLNELKCLVKSSSQKGDGFKEVRNRKRHSSQEAANLPKKATVPAPAVKVPNRNFFAPLRTASMETDSPATESSPTAEEAVPTKSARPPPIILTSATNLIQLQKKLKGVAKQSFEFRNTKNGTRVITKDMVDFQAVKSHFDSCSLSYYSFFPKADKPIKAVIRHIPINTPAEDIAEGLGDSGFDVVSVRQLTTTRRSEERTPVNLPLFLVTLPRTPKSQEIFKLSSLCHIAIKVEAYRSQNALTQCYNCQKFGHVWVNCKQPPRCLWCGGGHLHKECPEKGNAASTPACCNCQLVEGETAHPANYRGCRHAKEELRRKKQPQGTPKHTTGRVFSSTLTKANVSFAAALRGQTDQQRQQEEPASRPVTQRTHKEAAPRGQTEQRTHREKAETGPETPKPRRNETGQSVPATSVNSEPLDNMCRVITVVQQIMTELKGAVSEREKILAITNIVFNLMKENGQ